MQGRLSTSYDVLSPHLHWLDLIDEINRPPLVGLLGRVLEAGRTDVGRLPALAGVGRRVGRGRSLDCDGNNAPPGK